MMRFEVTLNVAGRRLGVVMSCLAIFLQSLFFLWMCVYRSTTNLVLRESEYKHQDPWNVNRALSSFGSIDGSLRSPPSKLVWLMSFPNSGTSFTLTMVKRTSLTLVASNYQKEKGDLVPVDSGHPEGPFWPDPSQSKYNSPPNYLLTKTHCGSYCNECSPTTYMNEILEFPQLCASGRALNWTANGTRNIVARLYNTSRVHKAVHLVRNPFNNIVSRFNLHRKEKMKVNSTVEQFPKSRQGFRNFCNLMNEKHETDVKDWWLVDEISILYDVPCRDDFYRYVMWHNLAFLTTNEALHLPILVLHYEDYERQFNDTASRLFHFLELNQRAEPYSFDAGHSYEDYFTTEERKAVERAFKVLASNETWHSIRRYFN